MDFGVNMNSSMLKNLLENCLAKYEIKFSQIILILTDAASYMIKDCSDLAIANPGFFHVTCLAHLLHNCAMNIRAFFPRVDKLIGAIQNITCKNYNNLNKFQHIGRPPSVIITRWPSWLRAALYYSKNLIVVKSIVETISGDGILITNAKNIVKDTELTKDLFYIDYSYSNLIELLTEFENGKHNIETGYNILKNLNFNQDPVELKSYIEKNQIKNILNFENENISPVEYVALRKCNPTSIAVERSFSMLGKFLAKDRNFKKENIFGYFSFYYNKNDEFKHYEHEYEENNSF